MSQTSPTLDLPLVMPAQAQKHVTVNEALMRLDALVQAVVQSRSVTVEPATPAEGAAWIIPGGASGTAWSSLDAGDIAVWRDGYWTAFTPADGWRVSVIDERAGLFWDEDNARWRDAPTDTVLAQGIGGAASRALIVEETLTGLSGSVVASSVVIPARAVVFCVSVRTVSAITGASSFDCGLSGERTKFGGSLGIAEGASNLGVIGPTAFYSDTPIELAANGGDFTGGEVAIAIHAWMPVAPEG
ncbi:DUF2793 domain-containing protein [Maricaulis maris]|uniref:DUF2793 domain-containing protein n=1 Tax=Maricaulis maris TaxID=74318 RepID=UPI003A94025D